MCHSNTEPSADPITELDDDNVPEETIIGGTRWTRKLRNAKIRLDRIK